MNKYIEKENCYELHIYGNKNNGIVLIDKEDYNICKEHTWYLHDNKCGGFYANCTINKKKTRLHRFILNITDSKIIVDHFNRDTLDCRKENLRLGDSSLNNKNKNFRVNNTSGRTGVCFQDRGDNSRWKAIFGNSKMGNLKQKHFSVRKYGYDKAFELACKQRQEWEEEFNVLTQKVNDN